MLSRIRWRTFARFGALLLAALACNLPGRSPGPATPATEPTPSAPTPVSLLMPAEPLPPALVESIPPAGGILPLSDPIRLFFNQEMDRASVERALQGEPPLSGRISWENPGVLVFTPDRPLTPGQVLTIRLDASARATNGLPLQQPVSLAFRTAGPLRLAQHLPDADAESVNPASAIVASFNRPVAPLGNAESEAPAAFAIEPAVTGQGEWINTSTYLFRPDPPMAGGQIYTVRLSADLHSLDGAPLETGPDGQSPSWQFTTAFPKIVSIEPAPGSAGIRLDSEFAITFNQPMDSQSVLANFSVWPTGSASVEGDAVWNNDFTRLIFRPAALLQRGAQYNVAIGRQAQAAGGTSLGEDWIVSVSTVPALFVTGTSPAPRGRLRPFESVALTFSGPLLPDNLEAFVSINPRVPDLDAHWDESTNTLRIWGRFEASTEYTLNLSADLADPWGGRLGRGFQLQFQTEALQPSLLLGGAAGGLFLSPDDPRLAVQVVNLGSVTLTRGAISISEFIDLSRPENYARMETFQPAASVRWSTALDTLENRAQTVALSLAAPDEELRPGLYHLRLEAPGLPYALRPVFLVVSRAHLAFKLGPTDALVWAVDLGDQAPLAGRPVAIFDEQANLLASGETDQDGIFRTALPARPARLETAYAVLGAPGDATFSMAVSEWDQGVSPFDFGYRVDYSPPGLKAYLYTDRPIYRPGHTVYYKGVLRRAFDGRYEPPGLEQVSLRLFDPFGREMARSDLKLDPFGAGYGEFPLAEDARPGEYLLETDFGSVSFQVAEFRKPEVDLQVSFDEAEILAGTDLTAQIQARFFFGAPAGDLPLSWTLFSKPVSFELPGYQVGPLGENWPLPAWWFGPGRFGALVASGQDRTGIDGNLRLDVPVDPIRSTTEYMLEVTIQDESGAPVSARASIRAHPAAIYLGVRPETWVGRAGEAMSFSMQAVDWRGAGAGAHDLVAEFSKAVWIRQDPDPGDPFGVPGFSVERGPVERAEVRTSPEGQAQISFQPPEPGTYLLKVSGSRAVTELVLWVGGQGQTLWPVLPNQQLQMIANQTTYRPGMDAEIFIPNPFGVSTSALFSVERGRILDYRVLELAASGQTLRLPLRAEHAPNVYVSATVLAPGTAGRPDFRQGYLNLAVEPDAQLLDVRLIDPPAQAAPGEDLALSLQVTDAEGQPVRGEFSVAVVDQATLALTEPRAPDIVSAFYGQQPLAVRTGLALAAYAQRFIQAPPGVGGGGGGPQVLEVRSEFADTAYWQPDLVTDERGLGEINFRLPDNLTTWEIDLRGLTEDTRVGQARSELVATKDLLVRPVTPRFVVIGDHIELAAVVHNNTAEALSIRVSLEVDGFTLDDPHARLQEITVPARGRQRVSFWGTVEDVKNLEPVFIARSDDLADASGPVFGPLPVQRYQAPQTFGTSGLLEEGGERLEVVSLPRSFDPVGGELRVELAPSLAAALLEALEALEDVPYGSTETTLSRFLPNLEAYRALQELGLDAPGLRARLDRNLNSGLQRLIAAQNSDGGWGWLPVENEAQAVSDPFISSYILFGLTRTAAAGVFVPDEVIERAVAYLRATLAAPTMLTETWQLDRLAFKYFALAQAGSGDLAGLAGLYESREQLSPWAQALLAMTLESMQPGDDRARNLILELQSQAVRSATGAHWLLASPARQNLDTPLMNSAIVIYALTQRDPGAALLPEAVRFLMAHRDATGGWPSTYETAWSLLALTGVMRGTGELGGDFGYRATLNGTAIAEGSTDAPPRLAPVLASVPLERLDGPGPHALRITRDPGPGRLYYRAYLEAARPVEDAPLLDQGIRLTRSFHLAAECGLEQCPAVGQAQVGDLLEVRLTLVLESDAYFLMVEDHLPAGVEAVDLRLRTSSIAAETQTAQSSFFDPARPYAEGWGWWHFTGPEIFDDRVAWAADFVPAGAYELRYSITAIHAGEFRVLPARAWMAYFPEFQGNGGGEIFEIRP